MSITHELTVIPSNGVETYRASTDAAGLCGAIVKATATKIQGKRYVCVEGWQAIAVAHGCAASSRDVEMIEGGIRAIGEVRRMSDGIVIATAEGFLGDDEQMWAKRPMYARRAMAQTRAISRVCRSAFAHVVVMIDKELSTTPAEEMMGIYPDDDARPGMKATPVVDLTAEAIKDGLTTETRSTYAVNKLNTAVANGWKSILKSQKGREEQVFDYLDMARSHEDVGLILNANVETIDASERKDEINEVGIKLLQWFEDEARKVHAA